MYYMFYIKFYLVELWFFFLHGDTWQVSSHHQMCLVKVDDLHKKAQKVHGQFSIVCSSKGKKARKISFGKFNPCMVSLEWTNGLW